MGFQGLQKVIRGFNEDGVAAGIVFQVVEKVQDNLASVRKICGAGNRVVFDDDSAEGSYILNKASGNKTRIELKNGNYSLNKAKLNNVYL